MLNTTLSEQENKLLASIERLEKRLVEGEASEQIIHRLITNRMLLYFLTHILPEDWSVSHFNEGICITHKTFLDIQDQFYDYEQTGSANWNHTKAISLLHKFLKKRQSEKKRLSVLWNTVESRLPANATDALDEVRVDFYRERPEESFHIPLVLGLPYISDEPALWHDFLTVPVDPLTLEHRNKNTSRDGIFYASKIYRANNPPCVDYFSGLYNQGEGMMKRILPQLLSQAASAGRSGFVDYVLGYCLGLPADHPFSESLLRAMEQPKITFNLNVFEVHKLVDLYNTNEKELDALWSASGVDLFRVIHNIVYERDRNTPPHKIWPYILSMMIAQLLYRKDDYRQSSLPPQQKIALYLQSLLGKLEISPRLLSSYPERFF